MRPYQLKKGRIVFVDSMSDLFHDDVPFAFIQAVFATMNNTPRHTYQVLTKRSERLLELSPYLNWTPNIWMGVSVEDDRQVHRIDHLRETNAHTKFLSLEPLIGPLPTLNLSRINWAIVGGESGSRLARPVEETWVLDIKAQCDAAGVAFFFKQWGGVNKAKTGRLLNGQEYNAMPKIL